MRAEKKDNNHNPIKTHLEGIGCVCGDCHRHGDGFPDMFVWDTVSGAVWLVEVKAAKGKLTPREMTFHMKFGDCPALVIWQSCEEAQAAVEAARNVRQNLYPPRMPRR